MPRKIVRQQLSLPNVWPASETMPSYEAAPGLARRTQDVRSAEQRELSSAERDEPLECASDLRWRRIAPARRGPRNGSSKIEREPTNGRPICYGRLDRPCSS